MLYSLLNHEILKDFDNGILTGMVLIDVQKGFDFINHQINLVELHGLAMKAMPYLADRAFRISIYNHLSKVRKPLHGEGLSN